MKYPVVIALALSHSCRKSLSFTIPPQCQTPHTPYDTRLGAVGSKGRSWKPAVSGAIMGWALATKIATAASAPQDMAIQTDYPCPPLQGFSTTILAEGAYTPEQGYDVTNLAMPSYTVKKDTRFNSAGTEAIDTPAKAYSSKGKVIAKQKSQDDEIIKAKEKASKEEAKIKEYVEKQQVRAKEKADKERIKAKIEAERNVAKETRSSERASREKGQ